MHNYLLLITQVLTCGFPPLENRDVSLSVTAGLDFFGGGSITAEERVSFLTLVANSSLNMNELQLS